MTIKNSTSKDFYLKAVSVVLLLIAFAIAPPRFVAFDTLKNLLLTLVSIGLSVCGIACWAFTIKPKDRK